MSVLFHDFLPNRRLHATLAGRPLLRFLILEKTSNVMSPISSYGLIRFNDVFARLKASASPALDDRE